MSNTRFVLGLDAGLLMLALCVGGGCSSDNTGPAPVVVAEAPPPMPATSVVLDGNLDEWPAYTSALADADYVYFRVGFDGEEVTLQAAPETLVLQLDVDGSSETGRTTDNPTATGLMGIDLEVWFSPQDTADSSGHGASVRVVDPSGQYAEVSHADIDLCFAPTYAAEWFECRISRHLSAIEGLPRPGLEGSGPVRGAFILRDRADQVVGWSDPFVLALPPAGAGAPVADVEIPEREPGTIRVMSYNVLKGSPMRDSDRFARIIDAVDPDVLLVQEWDDVDASALEGWFTALVPSPTPWEARTDEGMGVAIISPHPLTPLGPDRLDVAGSSHPVRFVGAMANTPGGDIAVGSIHLKCCGSKDSPEDKMRLTQAAAINAALHEALASSKTPLRVFGGDLNLVGSRPPLDTLRAGLDVDGSDLAVAQPMVLGDASQYTWTERDNAFTPGRLDYLVCGDARAEIVHAFVLDTARLSDAALARMGLDRDDSLASDHRPIVVDIRVR